MAVRPTIIVDPSCSGRRTQVCRPCYPRLWGKMRRAFLILSALLISPLAHAAEENISANFWQPICKSTLRVDPPPDALAGVCVGMMLALKAVGSSLEPPLKTCVSDNATMQQMVQVVTKTIDERPELMDESFIMVAIVATQKAWPCKF